MKENQKGATGNVSRRNFIATAGLAAVASGVLGGSAMAALPKEAPATTPVAGSWPWVKLDPQEAAERAFQLYHTKGG